MTTLNIVVITTWICVSCEAYTNVVSGRSLEEVLVGG